jgi:hypothetical protein
MDSTVKPTIVTQSKLNLRKLVEEISALGATCTVSRIKSTGQSTITIQSLPTGKTEADVQAVVRTHNPAPVVDPLVAKIQSWATLDNADQQTVLQAALKKLYRIA